MRKLWLVLMPSGLLLCFSCAAIGGYMSQKVSSATQSQVQSNSNEVQSVVLGLWGVRYQVKDVSRSIDFYTKQLGLKLDMKNLPAFGQVSGDNFKLILSGPGASGSRPMPDGRQQEPGGWNRIVLQVKDLPTRIEALKKAGVRFRNEMEAGPGGKQIQVEDPDGNPIELFEPASTP
jgi:glyoxylase I family protein